jgi:hypothetical protein
MPTANGGVGEKMWWAYVWCVIKGVMVRQAYCKRVKKLATRERTPVGVNGGPTAQGVRAYPIG